MDKEGELNNILLAEKIDHLKTLLERVELQNNKDHDDLITYQKEQNGKVKKNTDRIGKLSSKLGITNYLMPILTGLVCTLITYIVVK